MGTGKTTVAHLLADRIRWRFVDADDEIVARFAMTIPEIFAQHGEAGFRRFERIVCQSLAARDQQVIATGGGMLIDSVNRQLMEASGLVVCLLAEPDTIRERLADSEGRPLVANWETLYEQRRAAYAAMPYHVDTTGRTPEEVVDEVLKLWRTLFA